MKAANSLTGTHQDSRTDTSSSTRQTRGEERTANRLWGRAPTLESIVRPLGGHRWTCTVGVYSIRDSGSQATLP